MIYSFKDNLTLSQGYQQQTDIETIKALLLGCTDVAKANLAADKSGVDYLATLFGGYKVRIDAKTRREGASRFWQGEPELTLEIWSVMPGGLYNTPTSRAKVGWTLDESKLTDLVLFTFNPRDTLDVFLIPFQHLRMAFRKYQYLWYGKYKRDIQRTEECGLCWQSKAVFVPYSVVWDAIEDVSRGKLIVPRREDDDDIPF